MSSIIGALRVNLGLDSAQFESGAKKAGKTTSALRSEFIGLAKSLAAPIAAMVSVAGVMALVGRGAADIDKVAKSARRVGASVTGFRAFDLAATEAGVAASTLADSVQTMGREIAKGGKGATDALKKIGLSAKDLAGLDADEKLALISDQIKKMGLDADQTSVVLQGLGIRNKEMILAVQSGGDVFRNARKDIVDYGLGLSSIQTDEIEAANDAIGRLSLIGQYAAQQMSLAFTPAMGKAATAMTDSLRAGGTLRKGIDMLVGSLKFAAENIDIVMSAIMVMSATAIPSAITGLIGMTGGLNAAALAAAVLGKAVALAGGPWGILAAAIVAAGIAWYRFQPAVQGASDDIGTATAAHDLLNAALLEFDTNRSPATKAALIEQAKATRDLAAAGLAAAAAEIALMEAERQRFANSPLEERGLLGDMVDDSLTRNLADANAEMDKLRAMLDAASSALDRASAAAVDVGDGIGTAKTLAQDLAKVDMAGQIGRASLEAWNLASALGIALGKAQAIANEGKETAPKLGFGLPGVSDPIPGGAKLGFGDNPGQSTLRAGGIIQDFSDKLKALGGGSSGGGTAGAAAKEVKNLKGELESLEFKADPAKKYNAEIKKLDALLGGGLSPKAYAKAVDDLNKELLDSVPMVNDVANAFGDFIAGGLNDFKGFAKSILGSFKKMLSEMIATALRNKIFIPMVAGLTGGGGLGGAAASVLGGGAGGVAGAGGAVGQLGLLGKIGGIGSAFMAGIGDVMFGLMNGGFAGGLSTLTTALGGATTGIAGLATAAGAIALPLLAVGAVFSFFKKKTKELDNGLKVTVSGMDTLVQTFQTIQTKRFWGLSKKTKTHMTDAAADVASPIQKIVNDLGVGALQMAGLFGVAGTALDNFKGSFQLSLKGLSDDEAQKQIADALGSFSDQMVEEMFTVATVIEETASSAISGFAGIFNSEALQKIFSGAQGVVTNVTRVLSKEFSDVQREGEGAHATLTRVYQSLLAANDVFDILGRTLHGLTLAAGDVSSVMVEAFGGLDAMTQAVGAYWNEFYSEEERLETSTRRLKNAMEELGLTMPDSRKGFRDLVDGIDTSTKEGSTLYAQLISLSGAFAGITSSMETTKSAISDLVKSVLTDLDLMPTSQSQHVARNALQINETKALQAAQTGDTAAVQKYLQDIRKSASSDLSYREIAARVLNELTGGGIPSFSGGGYTGNGALSGGVDGKGGFLSVMHPRETVTDHSRSGGGNGALLDELKGLRQETRDLALRADRHRKTTADTLEKWDVLGLPAGAGGEW